jgi:hypothetical protein
VRLDQSSVVEWGLPHQEPQVRGSVRQSLPYVMSWWQSWVAAASEVFGACRWFAHPPSASPSALPLPPVVIQEAVGQAPPYAPDQPPQESRGPGKSRRGWIPAFAGMTRRSNSCRVVIPLSPLVVDGQDSAFSEGEELVLVGDLNPFGQVLRGLSRRLEARGTSHDRHLLIQQSLHLCFG